MRAVDDHQDKLLAGMRPPAAPNALKQRALAAARSAFREPRPTITDWLWTNRPLRMAWGTAVIALLAINLHIAVSTSPGSASQAPPSTALAWQCVDNEDQLQALARPTRSRSGSGMSLKELDSLLFEGPANSQPNLNQTMTPIREGDRV